MDDEYLVSRMASIIPTLAFISIISLLFFTFHGIKFTIPDNYPKIDYEKLAQERLIPYQKLCSDVNGIFQSSLIDRN